MSAHPWRDRGRRALHALAARLPPSARRAVRRLVPAPVEAAHVEESWLLSAHDDTRPNERLLDLSLAAIQAARSIDLSGLSTRQLGGPDYVSLWPGEHYRLLASFVKVLNPSVVLEIGSGTGLSALALKTFLRPEARLYTFDVVDWRDRSDSHLREEDLEDGVLATLLQDLTERSVFERHRPKFEAASLIFIDAAHDGACENRLLAHLASVRFESQPIVVLDDIRLEAMLPVWRNIQRPKLDLTSFGHWSGTGVVDWS